jgi:hypothetical protein
MRVARVALLSAAAFSAAVSLSAQAHHRMRVDLGTSAALEQFELQAPSAWVVENGALVLKEAGKPEGPIRKPSRWAIFKSEPWGDVTLRARVRADAPVERKGRDVLLFFGYQSPTRFYYVHLSNETTGTHNGIFIVKDADRKRLDEPTGVPKLMDAEWHDVTLVRDVDKGTIEVYFDREKEPFLTARDKDLKKGGVGVGSFDDPAAFADIVIEGQRAD